MIKSFNSYPFKVIFSIYISCQKHCVIAESHSYVYCHSQYFNIIYIYIYYLVKWNWNLNSLKSCRLLSAYESHRPVLNTNLLSRSIFQDHLFNTRFIQCYIWNGTEINSFNLVSLQVIFSIYISRQLSSAKTGATSIFIVTVNIQ